jgi:DNA-binding NarL/FixJ family response regulator
MSHLSMRRGDAVSAARWYGAADGAMTALGMELPAARRAGHERTVAALRKWLGEAAFAAAWTEGRANPAGVLTDARVTQKYSPEATGPAEVDEGLSGETLQFTNRQQDVLRLLSLGRTDREIAEALFISRTTASKHVAAILTKLEADSRTAAVATAIRLGLA